MCGYEKGRTSVPMEIREAYAKVLNIEWEDVREWDETSADLCEPVTRGTSDLSYLTSDELVAAISSRAEKLKASDGQVRLDLVRAIVKMAVELEKITEKEEGTE